jgi:hypothetical protein
MIQGRIDVVHSENVTMLVATCLVTLKSLIFKALMLFVTKSIVERETF